MRISDWSSDVCLPISDRQQLAAHSAALERLEHRGYRLGSAHGHEGIPRKDAEVRPRGRNSLVAANHRNNGHSVGATHIRVAERLTGTRRVVADLEPEIGSASCRERVCQYV